MAYEVTANRKRPQSFDELAGQDFVSITLKASIESGRIAHAYLFSGPRGCGKTSTARILAKSLNCERGPTAEPCGVCNSCLAITKGASLDVIEIDGASNTSVDNVRQIKDEVLFPPNFSKYKIYIIDEVHMLSNSAFNALLKTIEEPPPYIIFIFATTELHKVPATIRSRCQQFIFRLIPLAIIKERLESAAYDLGIKADVDALMWIAREATGSLRDAYTLFDQIASFSEGHIRLEVIQEKLGIIGSERIGLLIVSIAQADKAKTAELIESIIASGISVEQLLVDTIQYVRTLLFIKAGVHKQELLGFSPESVPAVIFDTFEAVHFERMLALLLDVYRNMRYSVNPRYEIELAMLMLCDIRALISRADIFAILKGLKQALVDGTASNVGIIAERFATADNSVPGVPKGVPKDNVKNVVKGAVETVTQLTQPNVPEPNNTVPGVENAGAAVAAVLEAMVQGDAMVRGIENAGAKVGGATVPGVMNAGIKNADELKARVLAEIGKADMILHAMLSKSGDWSEQDGRLAIACSSNFEVDKIIRESAVINQVLQKLLQRSVRVAPYVVQSSDQNGAIAAGNNEMGSTETDTVHGESSAQIVEKVFRGTRIREE